MSTTPASLDELLALLPDNTTGEISAADLRDVVTGLWDYTMSVQSDLNLVVVTGLPAAQHAIGELDTRVTALEGRAFAGEVDQTGTMVGGPVGWSATREGVGVYTVTHHLGTENYAVTITPMVKAADGYAPMVTATSATSFTYQTYSANQGGLHDVYTAWIVAVNP